MIRPFTPEGELETSIRNMIRERGFTFINWSRGHNWALTIRDKRNVYGSISIIPGTSKLEEKDTIDTAGNYDGNRRLSEVPEPILAAVREAIQDRSDNGSYVYSSKAHKLYAAAKK